MTAMLWFVVVALGVETVFFGNGAALVAGLITAAIGIFLETIRG